MVGGYYAYEKLNLKVTESTAYMLKNNYSKRAKNI